MIKHIKKYIFILMTVLVATAYLPQQALHAEENLTDIINKTKECFDFSMNRLTVDSAALNGSYTGFASKAVNLNCESSGSSLMNGDYAEIVSAAGKKEADTCLKIYADASNGVSNKNIQLYAQPYWSKINGAYVYQNLNPDYNFVTEFDVRSEDWNSSIAISLKMNNIWTNASFTVGAGKIQGISANEWIHIAVVIHKNSAEYSVYADDTLCVSRASLGADFSSKPTVFTAYSLKIWNDKTNSSTVYVDNIEWYEKYSDYTPAGQAAPVSGKVYGADYAERIIYDIPAGTSVRRFKKNVTADNISEAIVFEADSEREVTEGYIRNGMRAAIFNTDGTGYRIYRLSIAACTVKFDKHTDDNGAYKITASAVINHDMESKVIMAVYNDDGTLKAINFAIPDSDGNAEVLISGLEKKEVYAAKVFVWERSGTLFPISKAASTDYAQMHPFMLTDENKYNELRTLSAKTPWAEMKSTAEYDAVNLNLNGAYYPDRCNQVGYSVSAAALSFILNPERREEYKDGVLALIRMWKSGTEKNLYDELYALNDVSWDNTIPPASALANTILALDIVYPELTDNEISEAEEILQAAADIYIGNYEAHYIGVLGIRGLWALYKNDLDYAEKVWTEYLEYYSSYITDDGAGKAGTDYSSSRFAAQGRDSKILLPLVMEYTGIGSGFYSNEKYKNFAEWLLGYIYTPAKKHWCIGDSCAVDASSDASKNWLAFRASKFSQTAAKQAGWLLNGEKVRGRLMNYLLLSEDLPEMEAPVSRIFKDGGAWFYEDMSDPDTTAGFLWNADVSEGSAEEGHAHKEINSVNIYAYGEMLTVNARYTGWYSGYDGYTWNYINDSAISANTVLVNYDYGDLKDPNDENDHQIKSGGGITQGFTSDFIDYARGNSGAALLNANHDRSFIMTDKGYFVLFDSVKASAGDTITVVHRPMSTDYTILRSNTEYSWKINNSGNNVDLSVFEVNEPYSNEIIDGAVFGWNKSLNIKSLLAKYKADENGISRAAAILFPSDSSHTKPEITRYSKDNADCAEINFSDGTIDRVIQLTESGYTDENVSISGENAVYRVKNNAVEGYLAENALKLTADGIGFEANNKISICMQNKNGSIYCASDTELKLYGASNAEINGSDAEIVEKGSNYITIMLHSGESKIKICN